MAYDNLFSRGTIGSLQIKNRVVMPSMGTFRNLSSGEVSDHTIAYFEARAKGGVGLIITEFTAIDGSRGNSGITHLRADGAIYIPMLGRLADAVHKYGTRIFMQLSHAGRQTSPELTGGLQPIAPSPVPCPVSGAMPRELSGEEIKVLVAKFVSGAVTCRRAGMDGVELHGAHGYLINQFLSPLSNTRTDDYGGNFAGRIRFVQEIVEGIKEQCGRNFPVSVRLTVDEFLDGGIDLPTGIAIAKHLESIGVDIINVSCGTYARFDTIIEPVTFDQGWRAYLAEAVKKEVRIPVIAVGVIREPDFADALIRDG
ncbi:MAG: NADH:flavin oxidoreductase, partial [Desulfobacterales bacterium]|nr:NADH:flavin oxidoreductase [Desulfobacterales bacterium]